MSSLKSYHISITLIRLMRVLKMRKALLVVFWIGRIFILSPNEISKYKGRSKKDFSVVYVYPKQTKFNP
ncbi:hypothetical protein FHG68_02380 [Leptospira weilii]|nr:hypothetical protein FHG68_02380 [Leptospira weilii]